MSAGSATETKGVVSATSALRRRSPSGALSTALMLAVGLAAACAAPHGTGVAPGAEPGIMSTADATSAIVVCGERVPVDAPVVLWTDPGGYSAYLEGGHFGEAEPGRRYTPGRRVPDGWGDPAVDARIRAGTATRAELATFVDQFLLHYDVCGTSELCFRVLQDQRRLSVHFLLDLDGTIYQTLDLRDQAWHAAVANGRSVGIEIASIGAWAPGDARGQAYLAEWYEDGPDGTVVTLPERYGDGGIRSGARRFPAAVDGPVRGVIQGTELVQYGFTEAQEESLAALTAALHRALPGIALDVPRLADGSVRPDLLAPDELGAWSGLLAHWHTSAVKTDPGPALDWDRLLEAARER